MSRKGKSNNHFRLNWGRVRTKGRSRREKLFGSVPGGARVSFERKSIANQVESLIVGIVVVITTVVNGVIFAIVVESRRRQFSAHRKWFFFFSFLLFSRESEWKFSERVVRVGLDREWRVKCRVVIDLFFLYFFVL